MEDPILMVNSGDPVVKQNLTKIPSKYSRTESPEISTANESPSSRSHETELEKSESPISAQRVAEKSDRRLSESPEIYSNEIDGNSTSSPPPPSSTPGSMSPRSSRSASTPPSSPSFQVPKQSQTLPKPPSLFQPFLPSFSPQQLLDAVNNHPMQQLQRQFLPFSIDNILRPTFGGQQRLLPNPLLDLAASLHHHHQQQLLQQKQQLKRESELLSSSLTAAATTTKVNFKSQTESNNNQNSQQPVDLSSKSSTSSSESEGKEKDEDLPPGMVRGPNGQLWPAWVFCTRYSDRPSSGPRSRKMKKQTEPEDKECSSAEKRPRTAFSSEQLARLKREFDDNRYLNEERRKSLSNELGLNENQIKIWFQNKRAKIKKNSGSKGELAQMLMAQGLYNHSTVPVDEDENPLY